MSLNEKKKDGSPLFLQLTLSSKQKGKLSFLSNVDGKNDITCCRCLDESARELVGEEKKAAPAEVKLGAEWKKR